MDIGSILSKAWQITWKYKVLWIFGILAGCGSANGGTSNFRTTSDQNFMPEMERFFQNMPDWQIAALVIGIIVVVLILVVLSVFLGTVGRIGLIRGVLQADQSVTSLSFGSLFSGSLPYFWRVFGLGLLVGIAIFLFAAIFGILAVIGTAATLGLGLICLLPLICILIPAAWLVNVVVTLSYNAIVAENLGVIDGLKRGWEIFKTNLGSAIVMGLILGIGVSLIGGFIIGFPLALIIGPAVIGAISGSERFFGGSLLITGLCLVAYLPVLIVLGGILQTFISSSWTLTYLRLSTPPAPIIPQEELT